MSSQPASAESSTAPLVDATCPMDSLPALRALVEEIDAAVLSEDFARITADVEAALSAAVERGDVLVPDAYHVPADGHYARRLLHQDPAGRYTVICMTWGAGQGTPLHDHGDSWGSVCVYRGTVRVTPYEGVGEPEDDLWRFRVGPHLDAGVGTAASVVPPGDHHIIANDFEETAMSVHVYRGTMETCGIYLPVGASGTYRRELKTLSFDGA